MIDDKYIIEKFYNKDKDRLISPRLQHMTDEEKSYIENRFSSFNSYIESIYRIVYDIKEIPNVSIVENIASLTGNMTIITLLHVVTKNVFIRVL